MIVRGEVIQIPSSCPNVSTSFGRTCETITAISAFAARWSSRSFDSHPSLQFLVRLDSQRIDPQIWALGPFTALQDVAANSPLATGEMPSCVK